MAYSPDPTILDQIGAVCLSAFDAPGKVAPIHLMERVWSEVEFPMHCPEHHFLTAAVMLTSCEKAAGDGRDILESRLVIAGERAANVLGGFCGWYGACGAAVGCGIFLSAFMDASPHSEEGWADANLITGKCLIEIAALGGPRCCKRTCYTAVLTASDFAREQLRIPLPVEREAICTRHEKNEECLGARCPHYPVREVRLPRFVKKSCCDGKMDLTYKSPLIRWKVAAGDTVDAGDVLCEGEADKSAFPVIAPCAGRIARLLQKDGEKCAFTSPLCEIARGLSFQS